MTCLGDIVRRVHARKQGKQWIGKCPAHDDQHASLSLTERDGKILLYCHAGCRLEAICGALGIEVGNLFTEPTPNRKPSVAATYDYVDEHGKLLHQLVRYFPKDFRQRRPDGRGGWIWGMQGVRCVLYRLPDILDAKRVIVVEGEKDADTLAAMGFTATTNPGGAGKWRPEHSEALRGKRVAVIADADAPGLAHALNVARALLGIAKEVRLIKALPAGKDVTEWHQKGGTREQLRQIIKNTLASTPADFEGSAIRVGGLALTRLGDLLAKQFPETEYLWDKHLVAGTVSAVVAKPKVGKSTFARNLCLAVARGEDFLGLPTRKGPCIYLALEERENEVQADFKALGAVGTEPIWVHAAAAPVEGILALIDAVHKHRPVLVVIDPLFRFAKVRDEKAYAETYVALGPLIDLARETGAHLLMTHHSGKTIKADPIDAPLGSTAIGGAVSTLVVLSRTEQYRTIQTVQRVGADMPGTVLQYDPASHKVALGGLRADFDCQECEERILEYLQDVKEPKTQEQIREAVEGRTTLIRAALTLLAKDNRLKKTGDGKRGKPFLYEFWFSGSQHIAGTREPESKEASEPRINTGEILVPKNSSVSIVVPVASFDGKRDESIAGDAPDRTTLNDSRAGDKWNGIKLCRIHPSNTSDWWLRGGVDLMCGLCNPNPREI